MVAICASVTVIPAGIAPAIELGTDVQARGIGPHYGVTEDLLAGDMFYRRQFVRK